MLEHNKQNSKEGLLQAPVDSLQSTKRWRGCTEDSPAHQQRAEAGLF